MNTVVEVEAVHEDVGLINNEPVLYLLDPWRIPVGMENPWTRMVESTSIVHALREWQIEALRERGLHLSVPESIEDRAEVCRQISELRNRGFEIEIDDLDSFRGRILSTPDGDPQDEVFFMLVRPLDS